MRPLLPKNSATDVNRLPNEFVTEGFPEPELYISEKKKNKERSVER